MRWKQLQTATFLLCLGSKQRFDMLGRWFVIQMTSCVPANVWNIQSDAFSRIIHEIQAFTLKHSANFLTCRSAAPSAHAHNLWPFCDKKISSNTFLPFTLQLTYIHVGRFAEGSVRVHVIIKYKQSDHDTQNERIRFLALKTCNQIPERENLF